MRNLFVVSFSLIGFFSLLGAGVTTLNCRRDRDWCELRTVRFFNIRKKRFLCTLLTQARVEERWSDIPSSVGYFCWRSYQIWLHIDQEAIPLAPFYTYSKRETLEAVSRINAFIHDPQEQFLTVNRDNRLSAYSIAGSCILLAILIWFLIP